MSLAVAAILAALVGALIGSFLNVVIWRLPRGESIVSPPSHCPQCGTPVKPYDNVPVLSWLLLRGRCRHCSEPIPVRYPLVEALTAVLFALVPITQGVDSDVWAGFLLVLVLVPCTFIDIDHRIIPNKITYPAVPLSLVVIAVFQRDELTSHVVGGLAAFLFLGLAWFFYPAGMGLGDVKLALVLGLLLGRAVGPALAVAMVAGSLTGFGIMAVKGVKAGRKTFIPFGPFLALGGLVGLWAGDAIVDWYLGSFT